eukprot:gene27971-36840_t
MAFIAIQIQIWGNLESQSGMGTLIDSLDSLQNTFDSLSTDGNTLVSQGNVVLSDFQYANTASCNTQSLINTLYSSYFPYVDSFSDDVSPISDVCSSSSENLDDYGQYVREEVMWLFYALQMVVVLIFSVGLFFKSKLVVTIAIAFTELILLIIFSTGAILLVALMLMADFCVSPMSNLLTTMNPGSDYYNTVSYYTTCAGSNPLDQYLNSAQSTIESLLTTVQTSYLNNAACSSVQSYFSASISEMNAILAIISQAESAASCSPIQDQVSQGLQDGLCSSFFEGVYVLWLSQYGAATCFFLIIIVSSIVYQYFGAPAIGNAAAEPSAPELFDDDDAGAARRSMNQPLLATQAAAEGNRRAAERNWFSSSAPPPPAGARGRPSDFGLVEAQRLSLNSSDRATAATATASLRVEAKKTQLYLNTPLVSSVFRVGGETINVHFKLENLQPSGSFKDRGIGHMISSLIEEGAVGRLVSSSGGNAGHSVATIGRKLSLPVSVFVPVTTMPMMADKIRKQLATVIVGGSNWNEADAECRKVLLEDSSARYIPPFDDHRIWAGHSTLIDEIQEQLNGVVPEAIVLSVGGGGLLCGVQQGLSRVGWSNVEILAAETEAAKAAGKVVSLPKISTIASTLGALAVTPATLTSPIATSSVVVSDRDAVLGAVRFADEFRHLVEPACGAALSAVYEERLQQRLIGGRGFKNVVVIVCGGSAVSLDLLNKWRKDFDV